jgi:6-pyruvoyltetrahydropterin/6-carboxytetrahydropterin synthase
VSAREGVADSTAARASFGRRYRLSASHRLSSNALTADENRAAYGKCNNPYGHGHNYVVEVVVAGSVDAETGMVINMVALDEVVQDAVIRRFDHVNLNYDALFAEEVPTTENLCKAIYGLLAKKLPTGKLEYVRVEETENNFFQCFGS